MPKHQVLRMWVRDLVYLSLGGTCIKHEKEESDRSSRRRRGGWSTRILEPMRGGVWKPRGSNVYTPSIESDHLIPLITLDYVLRKGTQSNGSGKQARICVLCDAFCPTHSAATSQRHAPAPRQRCLFLKTNNHSGGVRAARRRAASPLLSPDPHHGRNSPPPLLPHLPQAQQATSKPEAPATAKGWTSRVPSWDTRDTPHFNHDTTRPAPRPAVPYVSLGRRLLAPVPGSGAPSCRARRRRRWSLHASCAV